MLARGALCRFAADVPKTSTHDLPRISHLLQSGLLSRNSTAPSTFYALSRAYKAALFEYRRSYATQGATKPTPKVKRDVKKAAAKKSTKAAKKAVAKKPKRKTAAKKKTVAKKKAKPKKKPAPKKKRTKKVLTPEQKEKQTILEFKKKALRPPTTDTPLSAWHIFIGEATGGAKGREEANQALKDAAVRFKSLTPAEKEHYNHLANEKSATRKAEYEAWIRSHTPEEIRVANSARAYLRRKVRTGRTTGRRFRALHDDRQPKKPSNAFIHFANERRSSGDMKGISPIETTKLCANEWKALSASEKKKYEDEFAAEKAAYTANRPAA